MVVNAGLCRNMEKRIEAAEMWSLRRMMRIFWSERMTNEEVLEEQEQSGVF